MIWKKTGVASSGATDPVDVMVDGHFLFVVPEGDRWWAIENRCSHAGCSFTSDGEVDGVVVICNCHGSEFDVRTGAVLAPPAHEPIRAYPTRAHDGQVEVEL